MKKLMLLTTLALVAVLFTTTAFASQSQAGKGGNPGFPIAVHVGWVLSYTPGSSITIRAHDGAIVTFSLNQNTIILPMGRSGQLMVGSRVTILARRDPSTQGWDAFGIVVHPAGSGAGSAPPTFTPTVTPVPTDTPTIMPTLTPTLIPSDTPTMEATATEVPSDTPTAVPSDTPIP